VKLPPSRLDAVQRTLGDLASQWGLDEGDIATWEARASTITTASHTYSTRVFGGRPAGFVRREIQVAHHVEGDVYDITALFSWDATDPVFERGGVYDAA
jgi:hypothetical protein